MMPWKNEGPARSARLPRSRGQAASLLILAGAAALMGCGGGETGTSGETTTTSTTTTGMSTLSLALARGPSGEVQATIHVADPAGAPVTGAAPVVAVQGGTAGDVTEKGGGDYAVTVTPSAMDREVEIDAESGGAHATKTAVVLSVVDPGWEQAEAIDGLVNTPGWEDGASVSADGEWLLVGSYVPLDVLTCLALEGAVPSSPSCNQVNGPYSAPERPDMLGAERILSSTKIQQNCPNLGFPAGGGDAPFAVPPVAAYGFHRQADGSYAEPFVIGFAADGCLGPYGFSFAGPFSGESAAVLFANDDPLPSGGDTANDLYWAPLTLGEKNILATYSYDGTKITVSGELHVRLPLPDLAGTQGNVNLSGGRLWWDDESVPGEERQLYVAGVTGDLPTATLAPAQVVGASRAGEEDIQPFLDGSTLYWMGSGKIATSDLAAGADPSAAASWTAATSILGPAASPDAGIVAVGEPTVARVGAETWLYFVYIKKTAAGYDANVARIRKRE